MIDQNLNHDAAADVPSGAWGSSDDARGAAWTLVRGACTGGGVVLALLRYCHPDCLLIEDRTCANSTFPLVRRGLDFWSKSNRLYFMNDETNIELA